MNYNVFLVEALGIESGRRGVSASGATTTDEALRVAAKVAIDAGDLDRARALLDLLGAKPHVTRAPTLAMLRPRR
jgi:hypothetical protein